MPADQTCSGLPLARSENYTGTQEPFILNGFCQFLRGRDYRKPRSADPMQKPKSTDTARPLSLAFDRRVIPALVVGLLVGFALIAVAVAPVPNTKADATKAGKKAAAKADAEKAAAAKAGAKGEAAGALPA